MVLVTGGPEVKLLQSISNFTLAYLPSLGRYFSSRWSWRMTTPAVTVLVVVSCVPIPIVTTLCALAVAVKPAKARVATATASLRPRFLLMMTPRLSADVRVLPVRHLGGWQSVGQFS